MEQEVGKMSGRMETGDTATRDQEDGKNEHITESKLKQGKSLSETMTHLHTHIRMGNVQTPLRKAAVHI